MITDQGVEEEVISVILDRVEERHLELSRRVTETIADDIGEYGPGGRPPEFWEDVRRFGDTQIRAAMKAGRTRQDPSPEDLELIATATVRRVKQGVPLEAIHHAFRLGHRIVWNAVVEEADRIEDGRSAALGLTLPFMRFVDLVCTCIAETYLSEQHRAATAADRAARDLLELLLAGDPRASRLAASESIPLDLDAGHEVMVARGTGEGGHEDLRHLSERIERLLGPGLMLAVIRQDELTCVIPSASGTSEPTGLAARCAALLDGENREDPGFRIGFGLSCAGLAGIAESHRQARSALAVSSESNPIVSLAGLPILEYLIAREDGVARAMVPRAVRQLATGQRAMDRALRQTLFAYLGAGMNVMKTAAALPAHPNTVSYRLGRLSERTGYDHRDLSQMVELAIAIRLSGEDDGEGERRDFWPTAGPIDLGSWALLGSDT